MDVPADLSFEILKFLFISVRHSCKNIILEMMNGKKNKSNSTLGYVPQSNLHVKILDIVNNRINPKK